MMDSIKINTHAPLYFVLLKCWTGCWGDSLIALRVLNVLLAVVTLPMIAMLLFAVSPFQVRVASEVRMYPLMALAVVFSSWMLLRVLLRPEQPWRWIVFSLAAMLTMYVHYFGLFLVAGQFLFLSFWAVRRFYRAKTATGVQTGSRSDAGLLVMAVAMVGSGWLAWLPVFLDQRRRVAGQWWTQPLATRDLIAGGVEWVASVRVFEASHGMIAMAVFVGSVAVAARLIWLRNVTAIYLGCGFLFPIMMAIVYSSVGSNLMVPRYFVGSHVLGLAVAIASIAFCWLRYMVFSFMVLLSVAAQVTHLGEEDVWNRLGIRAAVASVEYGLRDTEMVVVDSSLIYFPASFYASERNRWRLWEGTNGITFSTGLPVLQASDRVRGYDFHDPSYDGLWVVSSGNQQIFMAGPEWDVIDREFFDGSAPFQETVIVTHFSRSNKEGL